MKLLKYIVFLLILLPVLSSSCTERIDVKLDDSTIKLVVEGSITTERKSHRYFFQLPLDIFTISNRNQFPVQL